MASDRGIMEKKPDKVKKNDPKKIDIKEYLDFLEQYWKIFTPPSEPRKKIPYKFVKL